MLPLNIQQVFILLSQKLSVQATIYDYCVLVKIRFCMWPVDVWRQINLVNLLNTPSPRIPQ